MKTLSFSADSHSSQNGTLRQIVEDALSSSNQQHDRYASDCLDYYIDYGDHGYADYIDTNYSDYTDTSYSDYSDYNDYSDR